MKCECWEAQVEAGRLLFEYAQRINFSLLRLAKLEDA